MATSDDVNESRRDDVPASRQQWRKFARRRAGKVADGVGNRGKRSRPLTSMSINCRRIDCRTAAGRAPTRREMAKQASIRRRKINT